MRRPASPLSSRLIAEGLVAAKSLDPSTALIEHMQKNALQVVKRLQATGTIRAAALVSAAQTWEVA